ncbi:MAG: Ig-like domain-containing protein [Thaumarchaeota archaeon]|nr:Ig-like domain-containing protein [Nitrososphaerota archaeon]
MKSYAEEDNSFGVRIIPQKLIENSNGILQVYALHNDHIFPQKIENMIFSSTDSSILQVIGIVDSNSDFITNIKIKTSNPGTAKIELGAPGFISKEVPITVYGNTNNPTKLLVKSLPSTFSIRGSHVGYFTVETANNDGNPVATNKDIMINLAVADSRVLTLSNTQIIIKAGEYYSSSKFEINEVGTTEIFASSDSLESASTTITINQVSSPSIQMYMYPTKINNYAASISYVIAQLRDSSGVLSPAKEDITIPVSFVDPNANLTNSSPVIPYVEANVPITIKKGSYWGYTNVAVRVGANGTYDATISPPNGYTISAPTQLTTSTTSVTSSTTSTTGYTSTASIQLNTVTTRLYDDKSARLDILPILATGKDELIGILHLEDTNGNPIIASRDLQIEIDSSDPSALTVDKVILNKGSGAVPVFGQVGTSIPSSLTLHVVTYNDQTVSPTILLPSSNSVTLSVEPLVSKILSHSSFPVLAYLKDSSGVPTYFTSDSNLESLANDYFSIQKSVINKGDSIILTNGTVIKDGTSTVNLIAEDYQSSMSLQTIGTSSEQALLDYSEPALQNIPNTMMVQILDSNSNPEFVQKDTTLNLVSSNKTILALPENITISRGQYYTTFPVTPNAIGTAQVSIIADDLPLSTYTIQVEDLSPTLSIVMPNSTLPGETFIATVTAEDHGDPVKNMKIQWKVNGATVQNSDSVTNQDGIANISLVPNSGYAVTLYTNASGLGYISGHISKSIPINSTGIDTNSSNTNATSIAKSNLSQSGIQSILKLFKVNGMDTLPIVVLSTIAIGGILIKKNSLLSGKKAQTRTRI